MVFDMKKRSITHIFKVNVGGAIPKGVKFKTTDIFLKVQQLGGFYEGYTRRENEKMIRNAIRNGIINGRIAIIKNKKGVYVFC